VAVVAVGGVQGLGLVGAQGTLHTHAQHTPHATHGSMGPFDAVVAEESVKTALLSFNEQKALMHFAHSQVGVICQYVIVIELHKRRLFIYIPWTKSGLLTSFTYMAYADWSFCYLTYNVLSFYGLSYILYL
jgi:hypothetical protein